MLLHKLDVKNISLKKTEESFLNVRFNVYSALNIKKNKLTTLINIMTISE